MLAEWVGHLSKDWQIDPGLNPRNWKVHLSSGRYGGNISGIDAEDFPPIPAIDEGSADTLAVVLAGMAAWYTEGDNPAIR